MTFNSLQLFLALWLVLTIGALIGVAIMSMFFVAKKSDEHVEFAPRVPRLKGEERITLRSQIGKVEEELNEVCEAFTAGDTLHFIEECGDLYHAAGVLHRRACEKTGIIPSAAWNTVVQKNKKRGLYA